MVWNLIKMATIEGWIKRKERYGKSGSKNPEKTRKKLLDHVPWNKGRHIIHTGSFKKGFDKRRTKTQFKKGHKTPKDTLKKISKSHLGLKPWNKGLKGEEYKSHYKKGFKGLYLEKEDNRNWLGGKSFEPYDETFNNKFKREIRKRDNQVCMLCLVHKEKLNRALDVHHINYNKLMSLPQNCISLCKSCHIKTNFNRAHWIKFFQSLLEERYSYKYSNQEIVLEVKEIN